MIRIRIQTILVLTIDILLIVSLYRTGGHTIPSLHDSGMIDTDQIVENSLSERMLDVASGYSQISQWPSFMGKNYTRRSMYSGPLNARLSWKYLISPTLSSPAISGFDGSLYIGSDDRYLYKISMNGTLIWKYQTTNVIISSPALGVDETVYFGSGSDSDSFMYAVSSLGVLQWKYLTGR